jgi:hypothetical protein
LEYLDVQQEKLLRAVLSINIALPGYIYQAIHMVNFFFSRPCKKRTEDLLKLSKLQLRMVVAFLKGHACVKKHLNIMGLLDGEPDCRFCKLGTATVYHIICCSEALARQQYNFFGKFFAEPKEIRTASLKDLCRFVRDRVNERVLREQHTAAQ